MTQDFGSFLRSLGLRPRRIVPDGKWHRCGTEEKPKSTNGAYKLLPGGTLGFAQDWSCMDEPAQWRNGNGTVPEIDHEERARQKRKRRQSVREAVESARRYYAESNPLRGSHPYLTAKKLDMRGTEHLKVDKEGWLLAPMLRRDTMVSLQRIAPDGTKRFWPGAPTKGTTWTIDREGASVTVLTEGLATGLACFQALPTCRVIVAWNAGNLANIENLPTGLAVVAADNDHGTEQRRGFNPGIEAAEQAAAKLGCSVAYPEDIEGTDWADYRIERHHQLGHQRDPHQTDADIQKIVDGEIRTRLMKGARFVTTRPPHRRPPGE